MTPAPPTGTPVAVLQLAPTNDLAENLAVLAELVGRAAGLGARLAVAPEETMVLGQGSTTPLHELVEHGWEEFEEELRALARRHRIALVAGGYRPNGTTRPLNTLVAVAEDGQVAARYDKLHLYDAFGYRESDYVTPGAALPPVVPLAGLRVGLVDCYDLRFPELIRHLVSSGADLVAVCAAWVTGRQKEDHWTTLLRARAIESTVWVAAAGSTSPDCVGLSGVVDPMGVVCAALGDRPAGVAVADVSLDRTAQVRRALPVLDNRRIDLALTVMEPR